jgi:hypothetical protein
MVISFFSLLIFRRFFFVKSVVGLLEGMKHGGGIKDLDDKSSGIEILMTEAFTKIKPTDPLILTRHVPRRKRK